MNIFCSIYWLPLPLMGITKRQYPMVKIPESVKNNAYLVWTVGNRRVGKLEIKTDAILIELMKWHNIKLITGVTRDILHKRMATRNNIVSTMKKERILIFRKQPTPN